MNHRFEHLDALRGLAALSVVFLHCNPGRLSNEPDLIMTFPWKLLISGSGGVCVFFILSGFVLSYKMIGEANQSDVIRAMIKRPFRLLGVVMFTALFVSLLEWAYFQCQSFDFIIKTAKDIVNDPLSYGLNSLPAFWTIQVELWGSTCVFIMVLLLNTHKYTIRLRILAVAILIFHATHLSMFLFGILMADFLKHGNSKHHKYVGIVALVMLPVSLWLYSIQLGDDIAKMFSDRYFFLKIGAAGVFSVVLLNSVIQRILRLKIFIFLGYISFSLYAIHMVFTTMFKSRIYEMAGYFGFGDRPTQFFCIVTVSMSIGIAYFMTKWIDAPTVKLSERLARKIYRSPAAAGSVPIPRPVQETSGLIIGKTQLRLLSLNIFSTVWKRYTAWLR